MIGAQRRRIEPEAGRRADPHVMHENIGARYQRIQDPAIARLLEVQHDAALVAVQVQKHRRHALGTGRSHVAGGIAARRFHLDDIGTCVAEHLRGQWPKHIDGEIDHPYAGQRSPVTHAFPARSLGPPSRRAARRSRLPRAGCTDS